MRTLLALSVLLTLAAGAPAQEKHKLSAAERQAAIAAQQAGEAPITGVGSAPAPRMRMIRAAAAAQAAAEVDGDAQAAKRQQRLRLIRRQAALEAAGKGQKAHPAGDAGAARAHAAAKARAAKQVVQTRAARKEAARAWLKAQGQARGKHAEKVMRQRAFRPRHAAKAKLRAGHGAAGAGAPRPAVQRPKAGARPGRSGGAKRGQPKMSGGR